jgi:hypothetical protein
MRDESWYSHFCVRLDAEAISWQGDNIGWKWNFGLTAPIRYKQTAYFILPTVRVNKSTVSNGTLYQPIVGVLFGWGK